MIESQKNNCLENLQDKIQENFPRHITILLTRFPDPYSKTVSVWTRFHYTHASIGLDEDVNTFYSFVTKGFIVEKVTRYVRPEWKPLPCELYHIPVTEEHYQHIKEILRTFVERKSSLQYTKLGVLLSLLRIPHKRKNKYFCSQFVAEVLKDSQCAIISKHPSLYMPKDISKLPQKHLVFKGTLPDMVKKFGLAQN